MELFVYGTLLFPEVLGALLDRVPPRVPATACGWRVAALPGRVYPGLVPDRRRVAGGMVLSGLTRAECRLLDDYEDTDGQDYQLREIALAGGRSCPAYVWRTAVLPHDWDPRGFAAEHLADYVRQCARWRVTTGRRPPGTDR